MDYAFGSEPIFEILKCLERVTEKPFFIGTAARLTGFLWSSLIREPRPVSDEFIAFLRAEQKKKTLSLLYLGRRHDRLAGSQ
jgi:hypothetical protein